MKGDWKRQVARMTGTNPKLDKKIFQLKRSWDEVSYILNTGVGPMKKKKRHRR